MKEGFDMAQLNREAIKKEAQDIWEEYLSRVEIEAVSEKQMKTFYSCLYRVFLWPRRFYEIDKNGNAEQIPYQINNQFLEFSCDSLGTFAVVISQPYYGRQALSQLPNGEALVYAYDAIVEGVECIGVASLLELCEILAGRQPYTVAEYTPCDNDTVGETLYAEDFADVKGQAYVKRALEIAAAGGHNVIMVGAPGSGKTMLARRMPTIMPPMTLDEALETTKIHSVAGKIGSHRGLISQRPFRAPHHLTSQVALIGGGQSPQPGEVSLAHNGVLFLDEMPEFGRNVLEVLRQPLEDRMITISRAKYSVEYPSNFTLIGAMNPCPCGYYNHPTKECTCSAAAVHRYMAHVSGPLMDRIDMHIEVVPVSIAAMSSNEAVEPSSEIRRRVVAAREIQRERFKGLNIHCNAMMNSSMLREFAPLDKSCADLLEFAMGRLNLSARAYDRIIKVARTIADLEGKANIESSHISEAIGYRSLDRESWGR